MARRPRKLGWVRQVRLTRPEEHALSDEAEQGRVFTERLAENAWLRRQHSFKGIAPDRLTVRQIAEEEGISPSTVYGYLQRYRMAAFGRELTDSAIYHRLRRGKRRPGRCEEPGCDQPLPASAPTHRRYCNEHRTPAARVRRHRRPPPKS
jgi:hypothetical protein